MKRSRVTWGIGVLLPVILAAAPAFAADGPPKLDSGDTAWMLASTALVLLMTIPGLALFYAGMVRKKNILATMMQSFTICCIVTIVWMVAGYSIAFTPGTPYMGDFSRILLQGIADHIVKGNDTQAFVLASGIKGVPGRAGMTMSVTQIATAAAALGWMFAEWIAKGKPSVLGAASGAVAGLVAITPASGFVLPGGSIVIGLAAGVGCFCSATSLKHMLGYDDSLDCFGVHGVGGIIGALLIGVFAFGPLSASDASPDGSPGGMAQFVLQCEGVASTLVYSGVMSLMILLVLKFTIGLRVSEEEEREGLDIVLHGEQVF